MNKILPIEPSPILKAYLNHSFPLGIMEANFGEEILSPLLCHMFISCIYSQKDMNQFYIAETDSWFEKVGAISHQSLMCKEKDTVCVREAIEEARRRLMNGEYICSTPNEGKISAVSQGRVYDFDHQCLIYGFNDDEKFYQSIGYLNSPNRVYHYIPYKITYDEYEDALLNVQSGVVELLFYKVNKDFILPSIDLENILKLFQQYLDSDIPEYTTRDDLREIIANGELKFGISAWDELAKYIENIDIGKTIDMRYVRSYMEHKLLMKKRIDYLFNHYGIANSPIVEETSKIYRASQNIMALSIKFNLTKNIKLLKKISDKIKLVNYYEIEYLLKTIDCLSFFSEIESIGEELDDF